MNLERYKTDLNKLLELGFKLELRMQCDLFPKEMRKQLKEQKLDDAGVDKFLTELPAFRTGYQRWYSEAIALVRQIIPDRLNDFRCLYMAPPNRKTIEFGNYVLHDYLQGLVVTHPYGDEKVGPSAALPQFRIQRSILESAKARFESSLFDIVALAQADLFDSEIGSARGLLKSKFTRAAGAVAGVVLEKHLITVCANRSVKIKKTNPTIATLNDALKDAGVIDVAQWRFNQHLADIRNQCDHGKSAEPTVERVQDLIDGVEKVLKTIV